MREFAPRGRGGQVVQDSLGRTDRPRKLIGLRAHLTKAIDFFLQRAMLLGH
jgi:hypothetical protein